MLHHERENAPRPESSEESSAIVFGPSAEAYAALFSEATIGYRTSERAIIQAMGPYFLEHTPPFDILEVGAGTGQSTLRMTKMLDGQLIKYNLTSTEPNAKMIKAGRDLNLSSSDSPRAIVPAIQVRAEDLSHFPDNKFDIVYGSQMIHWVDDLGKTFSEASRVLKPKGRVIYAGSGIIKGEKMVDEEHFTRHPSYRQFSQYIKEELTERGIWNSSKGEFEPVNPLVNPLFHRYNVTQIEEELSNAGFTDIVRSAHSAPIDPEEMRFRMGAGNASMFLFGGEFAVKMDSEERAGIVDRAREKLMNEHPELLNDLKIHPAEDSTILFTAIKPK